MIRTLTEWLPRGASTPATIGGEPIQLMGRVAHFADRRVELSIREAAVLDTLLAAAPRVVSRTDLLAAVWDAKTDPHVCEVTIARLRKRLGDAAGAIVSVPRRGYVLKR
jgi:DNA-binding response OmpR family regulator